MIFLYSIFITKASSLILYFFYHELKARQHKKSMALSHSQCYCQWIVYFWICWRFKNSIMAASLLAIFCIIFALVIAVEKLSIEQLNTNNCKYELEQRVDDQNIEHILQWDYHAVKNCFQFWDPAQNRLLDKDIKFDQLNI